RARAGVRHRHPLRDGLAAGRGDHLRTRRHPRRGARGLDRRRHLDRRAVVDGEDSRRPRAQGDAVRRRAAGAHAEGSRRGPAQHDGRCRRGHIRPVEAGAVRLLRERHSRRRTGARSHAQAGQQFHGDGDRDGDRRGLCRLRQIRGVDQEAARDHLGGCHQFRDLPDDRRQDARKRRSFRAQVHAGQCDEGPALLHTHGRSAAVACDRRRSGPPEPGQRQPAGLRRQVRRLADRGAGKARWRQDRRAVVRDISCRDSRRMRANSRRGMLGCTGSDWRNDVMAAPSLWDNPLGTDGFEFVEYAAPDPAALGRLFEQMGFSAIAKHRSKNVLLYRQGDINFIVNAEPGSFAQGFARVHGPSICAMAFRVKDAGRAYARLIEQGAWGVEAHPGPMELSIPAIKGIGDSLIYLVDRYPVGGTGVSIYDIDFVPIAGAEQRPLGAGLATIDHLTHNVHRGRMDEWASFYERLFNFREVRYFDIEGKLTGLKSKAMTSPCGKIRIPINESSDDRSQIQEYLDQYHGEGIQHIALHTRDIYATVDRLREKGVELLDTPDTYYELLEKR